VIEIVSLFEIVLLRFTLNMLLKIDEKIWHKCRRRVVELSKNV